MRDYLIIVRAGDASLHPRWLGEGGQRSFDLMVSYYGTLPGQFRDHADHYHAMPGARWPAHDAICREQWELLRKYEYVAFACDDVDAPASTWDRLFAVSRQYQLDLAQPGIEGPISHPITARQSGMLLRYTNFVEIMCPIFRLPILEKLRWTLGESISGWALDDLWSSHLPFPQFKMAIIDAEPVRHAHPPGEGSLQWALKRHGVDKNKEMKCVRLKHGIGVTQKKEYGGVAAVTDTAVTSLYQSLTEAQRSEICFDWNYQEEKRGLLRSFLTNHWQITRPSIRSDFYTPAQQLLIHDIFKGLFKPEWYPRFMKQLEDDTKGHPWGTDQSIGFFGKPGEERCQLIITGRHMTLRADAHSESGAAFGGPILYGHAAAGRFHEKAGHPGNVFWRQAVVASAVYRMLDGRQRRESLVPKLPAESAIVFRGPHGPFPGIPVAELSQDQRTKLDQVLGVLLEPFRSRERWLTLDCLERQGGLDRCSLAFYKENQLSRNAWDSWRLEGPAFVWYFRGVPHVHVWVHVSRDCAAPVNATTGSYLHPQHDPLL